MPMYCIFLGGVVGVNQSLVQDTAKRALSGRLSQVVPQDQQSAGVRQYRDMVDATLEDTPVPEPQRPASADEDHEVDAFEPVELHMPEGAPGMQVAVSTCQPPLSRTFQALNCSLPFWCCMLRHCGGLRRGR